MARKSETYEEMLENLQSIVTKMDNGDSTLEESLKNYENGIKLCNKLLKTLNDAEGKIAILKNKEEEFKISED